MSALKSLMRLLASVTVMAGLCAPLAAQEGNANDVAVRSVKFSMARPAGGGAAWLETQVELSVRGSNDGGPYARFVDGVEVALSLGIEKRAGGYAFYRASATAVSLEAGRAVLRFYLPPEILQREQVNGDPDAYLVELFLGGRRVAGLASSMLRSSEALSSFQDHVSQAGPSNDGILLPQYDSPFQLAYPGDTPSVVHRPR